MSNTIERRYTSELRAGTETGKKVLRGYAAKYMKYSSPLIGFNERLMPGCFDRALTEKHDCRCLQNHDPSLVMGRTASGTLRLRADNVGLYFECDLPETQAARDLHTLVQRGDVNQCSFSFLSKRDKWFPKSSDTGNNLPCRDIYDLDLRDVSAVTYPVYDDTSVQANSLRSFFPNGIPAAVREQVSDNAAWLMESRLRLALAEL
jgi:hypothetical protein